MEGMIGEVRIFAGNFPPRSWAFCNGQLLAIAQNSALFSILGTIYGGDGRTTFALPDLRGRAAISPGTGPGLPNIPQGSRSGSEQVTLTVQNLPSHNHQLNVSNGAGTSATPVGNYPAASSVQVERGAAPHDVNAYGASPTSTMASNAIGNSGGNIPFNIRNPYLAANYIICLQGLYPSRN
ncbi:phage tail protein [Algoriphagus lutimaris]|uniref:phage tail protein n=1 Tax=Algoriphagus lutimaris TaxID=613197 RepID=UPI00196AEC9C|nr:tail fiber protein [Algoriphagus lutimaris]MBN3518962.1 phage tail protein [Algoriphagus lutimaris]